MKAITFVPPASGKGIPKVHLVDVPIPAVDEGEVLIQIHYAGLNFFDFETMRGALNKYVANALKKNTVISGIEMSGIAVSDGKKIKKGDRVFGYTNIFKGPFFHAEYVALSERKLALVPESFSLEGAASVIGGALTSIAALERIAHLQSNEKVLLTGATGSVGLTAVQLATHMGSTVSAVCNSTQTNFIVGKGATDAFAYDKSELPDASNQFDLVFDAAPSLSFAAAVKFLKPRGTYITTMPYLDKAGLVISLASRRKWGYLMESDTDVKRMERLRNLMHQGAFKEAICSIHPLSKVVDAFGRQQQRGKRGKILIDFHEPDRMETANE